jgi:hypothetical protein
MIKQCFLITVAGAVLFCGCDNQTKMNTEKIAVLSQKLLLLQEFQTKQLTALQSQLASLEPKLDKMNGSYFEKSHEDAIFFHTNTLYLLLLVDRKIEAELQTAETERQAEQALTGAYQTNLVDLMILGNTQIQNSITGQGNRLETNINGVNAETRRVSAALSEELAKQIRLLAPDAAELTQRRQMAADLVQIKSELSQIKAQLANTNSPITPP